MVPYFPVIESAVAQRRYVLGRYRATLLDRVHAAGAVQYYFLFVVYEAGGDQPVFVVASEYSGPETFVAPVLGTFDGASHGNLGPSRGWLDLDRFAAEALRLACERLGVPADQVSESEA